MAARRTSDCKSPVYFALGDCDLDPVTSGRIRFGLGIVILALGLAAVAAVTSSESGTSEIRAVGTGAPPPNVPESAQEDQDPVPASVPTTSEPAAAPSTPSSAVAAATVPSTPRSTAPSKTSAPSFPEPKVTTAPAPTSPWQTPADCHGLYTVDIIGGTANRLADATARQMSLSPDGQLLAYIRPTSARYETLVAVLDIGTGFERIVRQTSRANYGAPLWSPDGRTLVFVENFTADAAAGSVLAVNVSSGEVKKIRTTSPSDPVVNLSMSPDGRRLAFGRADTSIRVMNIDGTGERQVLAGIRRNGPMPWSPAGDELAYTSSGDDGGVFIVNMTTDTARRLTTGYAAAVAWSRTGDRLVATLAGGVHVIDYGSGGFRLIGPGADAMWSPDAASIAYGRVGPQEGTPERPIQRTDILVARTDEASPRLVVEDTVGRVTSPVVWSPRGDRILVACR